MQHGIEGPCSTFYIVQIGSMKIYVCVRTGSIFDVMDVEAMEDEHVFDTKKTSYMYAYICMYAHTTQTPYPNT